MSHAPRYRRVFAPLTIALLGWWFSVPAYAQDADPEEIREVGVVAKFATVLEKNPRRGTALDKVYGFHVERGSLDGLVKTYRAKAEAGKGVESSSAWMIVGLLESLRGQDAVSVDAFANAEKLDAANYLASYYLGQSLILVGQPDKAAEALERAIQRKPAQADQLDIFQALGRVYQRAQKTEKALNVWTRLEKQFPNDARVQEQIAMTLLEENEFAVALPRFENLARTTKDKYRQSLFQMEAAEIQVRLGKSAEAIKDFEKLLGQLNPDNWLFREVRRRIENVYLRTDDQAGLIAYYEAWTKKNPEDLEAVSRLAHLLSGLGRGPEAQEWLLKGLKTAPSRKDLRNSLIGQLVYEQKFPEAITQYEQLDKYEPNNPDTLREWGRLILKDTTRDESARKKDAAAVWRKLTTAKPKDPLIASQVAELFRHADMVDEALTYYRQAVQLAPNDAQYKEYLGEYFHSLKRKDEALETWRQMADGKAKTAANFARLAEVLAGFGYLTEAITNNAEACKLDPKEINLQIKQADLLSQAEKHEESLKQLAVVQKLAANDEEREAWLQRELKELQAVEQLKPRIAAVTKELDDRPDHGAKGANDKEKQALSDKWFWLARACEYERQLKDAGEAVDKAAALTPQSIPVLMASARILESQNSLLAAIETNTKLAAIDRRFRTEYLKKVAQLEVQLGRREKAIQAGRDLLAAAPGNPELYEFFSQLCFQLGQNEEGLQALRRSVRVNPTEPKGLLLLASALADQFRTSEAIELYWRAFDKAGSLDDRLGIVPKLTELYLQTNQFDRILERLERQRREPNQQREMTICLAQAYQSAGDDGNARQELEKLMTEDTRDTQLLLQLVKLCESDGDLDAAIRFQQQIIKVAPGKDVTMRLAQLFMKSGDGEEATKLLTQVTAEEKDIEQLIKSIDSLMNQKNYEQVLGITERIIRDDPRNWEVLYREGTALASTKPEESARRFESILALNLRDDELTLNAKNQAKKNQGRIRSTVGPMSEMNSLMQRVQQIHTIRQAVGMDQDQFVSAGQYQQPFWTPHDFGTARMASLAWLNQFATKDGKGDDFVKERRSRYEASEDPRLLTDFYYLASIRNDGNEQYAALKRLSFRPDADNAIKAMYLLSLSNRSGGQNGRMISARSYEDEPVATMEPLDKEEVEHVLNCYRQIGNSAESMNFGETYVEVVARELKLAGRADESTKMLQEAIDSAKTSVEIAMILQGYIQRGDFETSLKLLDRLAEMKPTTNTATQHVAGLFNYAQYIASPQYQAQILAQLMANRASKKELKDILALWDRYLPLAISRYESEKTIPTAKRRTSNLNPYGNQNYFTIWRGSQQQGEQLDFPTPNDLYDHSSIQMLRQAYVIYKDAENTKELMDHFRQNVKNEKASPVQKSFWMLGLGYLAWWEGEKDDALAMLSEISQSVPDNEQMTFELARMYEKRGDPQQALTLIESMPATDQKMMQTREIAALRMSVNSGNIDRARIAAERLFGLRLDSNLQIVLARQMHQLGMHEQAEAVLARAGRQAGNKTDVLMSLMQQYQSQGKNEVAAQIAHQLLRRSTGNAGQSMGGRRVYRGSPNGDAGARQQALIVMKRSGKLPEMIAKVETQLKRSPKSQKLLEILIEYYSADGNDKKVAELSSKIAESKSDDPNFRFQLAMQLVQQGKHNESLEHFKAALKREPRLLRNSYWEIQQAFQTADKLNDLADLYEEIDLKSFRQSPHELTNLISNMSNRDKTKERSITLFKKAWKELPEQRANLLQSLRGDAFWKLPEIYDYAREGIIPTEASLQQSGRWSGFGNIQSFSGEGKITTLMNRFLTIAAQTKKLDDLATEVTEAKARLKQWEAGEALLAMINLRSGKVDEGIEILEKLLPKMKDVQQVGYYTHWEIAMELAEHEKGVDLAIKYLEAVSKEATIMTQNQFQITPGKLLVSLYKKRGRKEDARKLLVQVTKLKSEMNYGNPEYEAYQRIQTAISVGNEFRTLGYPVDAIRIFQETLARTDDLVTAKRWGNDLTKQLQSGLQSSMNELKPELLPQLLGVQVAGDVKDEQSIDLVLLIDSRELDKTTLNSVLGNLVAGLTSKPEMLAKTKDSLKQVCEKRPDDFAAMILACELAFSSKDAENIEATIKRLAELVDRTPLPPQPAKGGFTPTQREMATQQLGLWLIARHCLKQQPLKANGLKFAERALEASRQNSDRGYVLAILREWGQIALEEGDREAAENRWTEMLEIVIPKRIPKQKSMDGKTSFRTDDVPALERLFEDPPNLNRRAMNRWEQMLAPAILVQIQFLMPAANRGAPATAGQGTAVNLAQFEQASQIAKMAADHGMMDLSLKAIAMALAGGPPVEMMQEVDSFAGGFPGISQDEDEDDSPSGPKTVESQLAELERIWRKNRVSNEQIYDLLKSIVLPESRPLEVYLYPRALVKNPNQNPQSVGLLFVQVANRAKKLDDLKAALEPRLKQPLGELSARVLATQMAIIGKNFAAAKDHLTALDRRLQNDTLQYSNELACHAAMPARNQAALRPLAFGLLERAVEHFAQNAQQGRGSVQIEPMRSYRIMLSRFHFQQGNVDAGKAHLKAYQALLVPMFQRFGGQAGMQRRRDEMIRITAEYALGGQRADSLDCLGQYADLAIPENSSRQDIGRAGAMIFSGLASLPSDEAYTLLKTWTLPTQDRQSVRVIFGLLPADKSPAVFDSLRGKAPRGPREPQLASTYELLIAAALGSGKLEELANEVRPYADQNVENAKSLFLMTQIALSSPIASDLLRKHIEERRKDLPPQGANNRPPQVLDAVLAKLAMYDPQLNGLGRELGNNFITHCTRVEEHSMLAMMRRQMAASSLGDEMTSQMDHAPTQTGLKYWTAGSVASAKTEAVGAQPMWWVAHEGMISHLCGPDQSHLYFKYPLTGSFEVACDAWMGPWSEGNIGYGGVAFMGLFGGTNLRIFPVGNPQRDVVNRQDPFAARDRFNRIKISVQPDKVSYSVAGSLVHEEQNSGYNVSPWFFLHCDRVHQTCFKNFQITGQPVIPRQVNLSRGSSLLGWSSEFYNETQPRNVAARLGQGPNRIPGSEIDWQSNDGIIQGRAMPVRTNNVRQSCLFYDRPLLDGDRLSYDFWYAAGVSLVHPALDRLAFLLTPEGVKLHWMTDGIGQQDIYSGLAPLNALVDPTCQRGPVSFLECAWNRVEVSISQNIVTIALNGKVVCVRTMESDNSRQFGLYHDKNSTDVKVRHVALTGEWPKTLSPEILGNLLERERQLTDGERQALGSVIDEKFHFANVDSVLIQTRQLTATDRYNALKNWVLPNVDHTSFRFYGAASPADLPPPSPIVLNPVQLFGVAKTPAPKPVKGLESIRQRTGGELIAPVLDLVSVARELGKLDELLFAVHDVPDSNPQIHRSCLAMFSLIDMARGDWKQAEARLIEQVSLLRAVPDDGVSVPERWPELVVAWEALRHPALRRAAIKLFDPLIEAQNRKWFNTEWEILVRSARHYAYAMSDLNVELPNATAVSPRGQWTQVPLLKKDARSRGMIPRWIFVKNEARHLGGEGNDLLVFQSPLQGKFTIEGEFTNSDWREVRVMYGAFWATPRWDFSVMDLGNLTGNWDGLRIEPKLPTPSKWYSMRVEVEPGKSTYFLMGQKVHEQPLPEGADPWVAIHSWGHYGGAVRGLRISGQPTIPESLKLSSLGDLTGWLAEQYGEWTGGNDPLWRKEGNEIIGRSQPAQEGHGKQSILQYHRPMLEDGEITYEFFYVPNRNHIHPALDRLAFMLDPEGVKIHWLTDAHLDRSGLPSDNIFIEPQNRRGDNLPLKPNEWNTLALTVKGDTATLTLNGQTVYERLLEPTNLRNFGLFRFMGNAEARVRNVTFKGNWPKTLPPLNEQEFEPESPASVAFRPDELRAGMTWNFKGPLKTPLTSQGTADGMDRAAEADGMRLTIKPNSPRRDAGYSLVDMTIKGDFELTLGYRDFKSKSTPNKEEWNAPRIEILLALGAIFETPGHTNSITFFDRRTPDQKQQFVLQDASHPHPQWKTLDIPHSSDSSRLRLIRRGSSVYYLRAEWGSENWRILDRREIPPGDVKAVGLGIRTYLPDEEASCVFTELSIRCQQFDGDATQPAPFGPNALPDMVQWDFRSNRPASMRELGNPGMDKLKPTKDGLHCIHPANFDQGFEPAGIQWNGELNGDFELTLNFRNFQSKPVLTDWRAPRVDFNAAIYSEADPTTHVTRPGVCYRRNVDGSLIYVATMPVLRPDGSMAYPTNDLPTKQKDGGRIRLVRQGTTLFSLAAPPESEAWQPIGSRPVEPGPVRSIAFGLRSEDQAAPAEVLLTGVTIRAKEIRKK